MADGHGEKGLFEVPIAGCNCGGKETKRKQTFKPYDQEQTYLFPAQLDDYVGRYHIARLVSMFIDNIDLSELIEEYKGGASAFNPSMLLKSWILGYIYRIYTCRPLQRALRENAAFMWISGNQRPDYHTLNNFRNRLKKDINTIFKEIVKVLLERDIIKGEDIFIDHTKMEANANRHKMVWKKSVKKRKAKIEEELNTLLRKIEKIQAEEGSRDSILETNKEKIKEALNGDVMIELIDKVNAKLKGNKISRDEASEQKKDIRRMKELLRQEIANNEKEAILGERSSYSRTDPDASAMLMKDEVLKPGYNEGIAVENGFVVAYGISQNAGDNVSFKEIVEEVKKNIGGEPGNIGADGAYGSEENLEYLEKEGIEGYVKYNTFHQEQTNKYYQDKIRQESFIYNKTTDSYKCPQGVDLKFVSIKENITATGFLQKLKVYAAQAEQCAGCPLKDKCTKGNNRTLSINENYNRLKQNARENLFSSKGISMRKRRGYNVETVFGDRKGNHKFRRYNLRGKENVAVESGLYYCMHNIKRLYFLLIKKAKKLMIIPQITMNVSTERI
jgi:transposase